MAEVSDKLTWRTVFSFCGKLVGHYPMSGWLRMATAFTKRRANEVMVGWDEIIVNEELMALLKGVVDKIRKNDPIRGRWCASSDKARVWIDASSMALGVAVEINGAIIKDASWLRKDCSSHINMAELDAVIKGLNLALAWKLKEVEILIDSSTMHHCICDGISGRGRLKTSKRDAHQTESKDTAVAHQGMWPPAVSHACIFYQQLG